MDQILIRDKAALCHSKSTKHPLRCFYLLYSESAVTGKSPYGGELVLLSLHSSHHSSDFGAMLGDRRTAETLPCSSNSLLWNCILSFSRYSLRVHGNHFMGLFGNPLTCTQKFRLAPKSMWHGHNGSLDGRGAWGPQCIFNSLNKRVRRP